MAKGYLFDQPSTPLVYSTPGVNMDFVEHKEANVDPDIIADNLTDSVSEDSPITLLEKTLTITGAAQVLTYTAPAVSDPNSAGTCGLIALEIAVQLNELSVPKTDFNFTIKYLNAFGTELTACTQQATGNASIKAGNTRQYMRFMPFIRNGKASSAGAISLVDGRISYVPRFASAAVADIAALVAAIPAAESLFAELRNTVATVSIEIPASSMTPGTQITVTPVTTARRKSLSSLVLALDEHATADSSAADMNDDSTKMLN